MQNTGKWIIAAVSLSLMGCQEVGTPDLSASAIPEVETTATAVAGQAAGQTGPDGVLRIELGDADTTVDIQVSNADGQPLPGVEVVFEDDGAGMAQVVVSDPGGDYASGVFLGSLASLDVVKPEVRPDTPKKTVIAKQTGKHVRLPMVLKASLNIYHYQHYIEYLDSVQVANMFTHIQDQPYQCLLPAELIRWLVEHKQQDQGHVVVIFGNVIENLAQSLKGLLLEGALSDLLGDDLKTSLGAVLKWLKERIGQAFETKIGADSWLRVKKLTIFKHHVFHVLPDDGTCKNGEGDRPWCDEQCFGLQETCDGDELYTCAYDHQFCQIENIMICDIGCDDGMCLGQLCGDGRIDGSEVCDQNSLACSQVDAGFASGQATCNGQCTGYLTGECNALDCVDIDDDGISAVDALYCPGGEDHCDQDNNNWQAASCLSCDDLDGDGYWFGCDAYTTVTGTDHCDDDNNNWTMSGCTQCIDTDGDGYGLACDRGEDCDETDELIWSGCPITDPSGATWVSIPSGCFEMGNPFTGPEDYSDIEYPVHDVCLSPFDIMAYEVTNGTYEDCVDAGNCSAPSQATSYFGLITDVASFGYGDPHQSHRPVNYVSWYQALDYCHWAGAATLPTEAQWEYAARGGLSGKRFPWGDTIDCSHANYFAGAAESYDVEVSGVVATPCSQPDNSTFNVGSHAPNGYGLYDMTGNVSEWVNDKYDLGNHGYDPEPVTDPTGPVTTEAFLDLRVFRGGSFTHAAIYNRVAGRNADGPSLQSGHLGFRCARPTVP